MTDVDLLQEYIRRDAGDGKRPNIARTAQSSLMRDVRTVHRWLNREMPIPAVVTRELARRLLVPGKVTRARLQRPGVPGAKAQRRPGKRAR